MNKFKVIKSDLYDIAKRLKEIDKGYFVVRCNGAFELHNNLQKGNSFCLKLPFNRLDCRTLNLALKTRVEKAESIFLQIEQQNKKLIRQQLKDIAQKGQQKTEEFLYDN